MYENFEQLLNESTIIIPQVGQLIDANVIQVNHKDVVVDFGAKSEVVLAKSEFSRIPAVGEGLKLLVVSLDDGHGNLKLSHQAAEKQIYEKELKKSFESQDYFIEVQCIQSNEKGLICNYHGINLFVPTSLIDSRIVDNSTFLGQSFLVKVVKFMPKDNNFFASRRFVLEKQHGIDSDQAFKDIKVGDKLRGRVKSFMNYGAFINLGFMDSLLHVNDISWKNFDLPSEGLKIGEDLTVVVVSKDEEKKRISVSLKDIDQSPWLDFKSANKEGSKIQVEIIKIQKAGFVVRPTEHLDLEFFIPFSDLGSSSDKTKIQNESQKFDLLDVILIRFKEDKKSIEVKLPR